MISFEKGFLRSRVARRIFALFVLCALVPLAALAWFSFSQVSTELVRQAHRRLANSARATGMGTIQRFQFLAADCETLCEEILGRGLHSMVGIPASLRERASEPFADLALEDSATLTSRLQLTASEFSHLDTSGVLAKLKLHNGELTVFFVERVGSDKDQYLVGRVRQGYLFGDTEEDQSEFVSVFGPDGDLVFSQGSAAVSRRALLAATASGKAGGEFRWGSDDSYVASYWTAFMRPQFHLNLTFVTSQATVEVLEPVRYFRLMFGLSCLLTFFVVLLLSFGQIRRELVPITELRAAAERIAREDHSQRVEIRTNDEFAVLGATFNEMSERILERTEALEQALAVKDQFVANMCHEIRTPLNGILGYADLCADPDLSIETLREHVEVIGKSGSHLLDIVNDILDVAKIRAGRLSVEPAPCSVGDVIDSAVELLAVTAEAKGLQLTSETVGPIPKWLLTDGARLRQVLLNVIGNAVKFTDSGAVRVRTSMKGEGDSVLEIRVADTGVGMTAEEATRVFEPFVQGDNSMTRRSGGTGLGLSIARALARELGGDLTCGSEPGVGSTFTLTIRAESVPDMPSVEVVPAPLPVEPLAAVTVFSAGEESTGGEAEASRVLVVEDVPMNRKLVVTLMKRQGYRVEEAENGKVGLDLALESLAAEDPFDVILMDMQMPVMDGYAATRELRSAGYRRSILALTAHSAAGEREKCLAAGCDDYLTKPFAKDELLELVAALAGARTG